MNLTSRRPLAVLLAALMLAAGCRAPHEPAATATPAVEPISYGPLAARAFVAPGYIDWIDVNGEFVLDASEAADRHSMALGGDSMQFTDSPSPTVSADETKALVGVRSGDGLPGVLLVRRDGTSMGMYVFRDRSIEFGSVGFAPRAGLTLFGASGSEGSRVVAITNYARIQFELPVSDYRGRVLVSPDLSYIALLRDSEIELVPLDSPGDTTVLRDGVGPDDDGDLYREALRLVSRW